MILKKVFLLKASNLGLRSPLLSSRRPQYVNEISDICNHFQAHGSDNLNVSLLTIIKRVKEFLNSDYQMYPLFLSKALKGIRLSTEY